MKRPSSVTIGSVSALELCPLRERGARDARFGQSSREPSRGRGASADRVCNPRPGAGIVSLRPPPVGCPVTCAKPESARIQQ